ncbi:MAG: immunity 17 family protein [Candidatus Accumulibacter sp.]|jgi:hypothetical protein|nr:immunity 17 family protein [Accumulibacter sp.]
MPDPWNALKNALGAPLASCLLLFLGGAVLVTGVLLDWKWLYPGNSPLRNLNSRTQRRFMLLAGILVMGCSVFFYIFRDSLHWN